MEGAPVELRIHDRRAVLVRYPRPDLAPAEWWDPGDAGLSESLTSALHEWARVAATVGEGRGARDSGVAPMVSRRGRQLAARVAESVGVPVYYSDPLDGTSILVRPVRAPKANSAVESLIGTSARSDDRVPWLTGLVLALFTAIVLVVAMLAVASTLAERVSPWVAVVAALVITAGLAPSLWLGRQQLILRWVVLGAACGIVCTWIGVLALVL